MNKSEEQPKKRRRGRPKAEIDPNAIRRAAAGGASVNEIARRVGFDEKVLRNRFMPDVIAGKDARRRKIRAWQMKCAKSGNPAMLIWLGKNELDQTDKQTVTHEGGAAFTLNIGTPLGDTNGHAKANGSASRIPEIN